MYLSKCLSSFLLLSFPVFSYASDLANFKELVDVTWVIAAGTLVFFMQAGFALLESGLSRAKNSVNVIMKNYADLCVGSVAFTLVGFGLMFGHNQTGFIGSDHFVFLNIDSASEYAFLFFQIMFAATAATITSGAMAERTQFFGYLVGAVGICAFIYPVFGSWVWGSYYEGKGWLAQMGFIDFAGSTVVHSIGGWCALAAVIVLKPRLGRFSKSGKLHDIPGHNLNYMALGGFIIWLGWFGFNAGSTLAVDESIGLIALNTHLAAASGVISVVCLSWLFQKPVLARQAINGGITGLVGITAGCATMTPFFAVITGLLAGVFMLIAERLMEYYELDDVVGAVAAHGVGGAWGTLAAGMFLTGNLFDPSVIVVQLVGIAAAFVWAFPVALLMYFVIEKTVGLRASSVDERRGLDYTEHYELGYPEFQQNTMHK